MSINIKIIIIILILNLFKFNSFSQGLKKIETKFITYLHHNNTTYGLPFSIIDSFSNNNDSIFRIIRRPFYNDVSCTLIGFHQLPKDCLWDTLINNIDSINYSNNKIVTEISLVEPILGFKYYQISIHLPIKNKDFNTDTIEYYYTSLSMPFCDKKTIFKFLDTFNYSNILHLESYVKIKKSNYYLRNYYTFYPELGQKMYNKNIYIEVYYKEN